MRIPIHRTHNIDFVPCDRCNSLQRGKLGSLLTDAERMSVLVTHVNEEHYTNPFVVVAIVNALLRADEPVGPVL